MLFEADYSRECDGQPTGNLLRALKRDMPKKEGSVDRQKLRKEGYSERLLTKLDGN